MYSHRKAFESIKVLFLRFHETFSSFDGAVNLKVENKIFVTITGYRVVILFLQRVIKLTNELLVIFRIHLVMQSLK